MIIWISEGEHVDCGGDTQPPTIRTRTLRWDVEVQDVLRFHGLQDPEVIRIHLQRVLVLLVVFAARNALSAKLVYICSKNLLNM